MKEILSIQIGGCGIQMGEIFWSGIADEHGLDPTGAYYGDFDLQLENIHAFLREREEGNFIGRSIFVDLGSEELDYMRRTYPFRWLFSEYNIVNSDCGTCNNWAKGFYTEGGEIIDDVMDIVREEVEKCEKIEGFQISHSLGGGTGSGMGSLLISNLRQEYPSQIIQTFSVFPSPLIYNYSVVQPYNSVLALHHLIEDAHQVMVLDNQALFNILSRQLQLSAPTYRELNMLIGQAMTSITCSIRFGSWEEHNKSLSYVRNNLIPFEREHFLMLGISPLPHRGAQQYYTPTTRELAEKLFDGNNTLCDVNLREGKFISAFAQFRGRGHLGSTSIQQEIDNLHRLNKSYFAEYIPDSLHYSSCDISALAYFKMGSAALISNSTAVQGMFNRIYHQFHTLYKRNAFFLYYENEGMDAIQEFSDAQNDLTQLISQYQDHHSMDLQQELSKSEEKKINK